MTDAATGQPVRLSIDNWLGLVALVATMVGAIVWQTTATAKVATMVEQHESRIARIEHTLDKR